MDQPRVYMELQPTEAYQSLDHKTGRPPTGGAPDRGSDAAYENVGMEYEIVDSAS